MRLQIVGYLVLVVFFVMALLSGYLMPQFNLPSPFLSEMAASIFPATRMMLMRESRNRKRNNLGVGAGAFLANLARQR